MEQPVLPNQGGKGMLEQDYGPGEKFAVVPSGTIGNRWSQILKDDTDDPLLLDKDHSRNFSRLQNQTLKAPG